MVWFSLFHSSDILFIPDMTGNTMGMNCGVQWFNALRVVWGFGKNARQGLYTKIKGEGVKDHLWYEETDWKGTGGREMVEVYKGGM